jgi:DNA processing protein
VDRIAAARRDIDQVDADLAKAADCGLRVVVPEDEEWPAYPLLRMESATARGVLDLAPPLMFWVGGGSRLDELVDRSVAVVGSRAATSYGARVASTLSHQLASRDWTVVSGGAFGIDAAAHKGALSAGGRTVAVVAGGLDMPYPGRNRDLFERIVKDGGLLLSEWPPGSPPQRHRFLVRNRVIAGLVSGTVVVEAGTRSGASQTARRSRELGVPVMAVPGPVVSAMSVGCHQLIRAGGASLVTNVDEVLEEVGRLGDDLAERPRTEDTVVDRLDATTRRVLDGLPSRSAVRPEEIASAAGVDILTVLRCLPALELLGLVRHEHGVWALPRTPPRSPRTA